MKTLEGLTGLLGSKKGVLSLIVTVLASALCWHGRIDGTALAAIVGTVATIFMYTNHKVDIASIKKDGLE